MSSVLLLNADYRPLRLLPLSTISWQSAVKGLCLDRVEVIKNYENRTIRSVNWEMEYPSIVRLKTFHKFIGYATFNRRNLYIRDNHTCQYCGKSFHYADLTIDHVHPKSLGGDTSWTNCTTSCLPCNSRKGAKLIRPIHEPYEPNARQLIYGKQKFKLTIPDPAWQDYLCWPEDYLTVDTQFSEQFIHA